MIVDVLSGMVAMLEEVIKQEELGRVKRCNIWKERARENISVLSISENNLRTQDEIADDKKVMQLSEETYFYIEDGVKTEHLIERKLKQCRFIIAKKPSI